MTHGTWHSDPLQPTSGQSYIQHRLTLLSSYRSGLSCCDSEGRVNDGANMSVHIGEGNLKLTYMEREEVSVVDMDSGLWEGG